MKTILSGLVDYEKVKVRQCTLAKEPCDKLQDLYAKQGALEMSKYETSHNSYSESDVEETNFSRNPKRGSGQIQR
jgi:hypothetical protein